jgi:hypothetical protein
MSLNNLASKNTSGNIITPIMLYPAPSVSCTHGGLLLSPTRQEHVEQKSDKLGHIGNPYYGLYNYGYGYPWWYPYGGYCGYGNYCGYRGYYGYPWYI